MKKIILITAALFTMSISAVYANNEPVVSQKVKNAFEKQFSGASYVQWENQDEIAVAIFLFHDVKVAAYYDQEGKLHATLRTIFYNQLPLAVMSAIENKYQDDTVVNITEIVNSDGTSYKVLLENNKDKINLKINASGNILNVSKVKS